MALSPDQVAAAAALATTNDPVAVQDVPQAALFYSAQDLTALPAPGNFLALPAWPLGNNCWLLDDLDGDVQAKSASGNRTMDDGGGPPLPGDGGGGGGSTNSYPVYSFDTNTALYLELVSVGNGLANLNLHNVVTNGPHVYAIWSASNLLNGWSLETAVWAWDTNCISFSAPQVDGGSFFYAQDLGVTAGSKETIVSQKLSSLVSHQECSCLKNKVQKFSAGTYG